MRESGAPICAWITFAVHRSRRLGGPAPLKHGLVPVPQPDARTACASVASEVISFQWFVGLVLAHLGARCRTVCTLREGTLPLRKTQSLPRQYRGRRVAQCQTGVAVGHRRGGFSVERQDTLQHL